jgi:valacyclovir hydrolase
MPTMHIGEQEIHYLERGAGEALLIFPDDIHAAAAYEAEMARLADGFRVLAFDAPGTGESTRDLRYLDEREFDPWNYRADLACHLLLDLGIDRCFALGAGGGALAALHFAGRQAALHRLTPLGVVADSFLPDLDRRTLHRALDRREHYLVRHGGALRRQHGEDWRAVIDADTAFQRGIADRGGYAIGEHVLNAIRCPVLLTGSLQDDVTPGIAAAYARIAGIVPDCSVFLTSSARHPYGEEHPLMWADPEAFRSVVDRFLARLS